MSFLEGLFGTVQGSFYKVPAWVDESKPPGMTSQSGALKGNPNWSNLVTGAFLVYSPNAVWMAIALAVYFYFPYDLDAVRDPSSDAFAGWMGRRALLNLFVVYTYYGWWHVTLYFWWGKRPFNPARQYRFSKVAHNIWYTTLGTLQWTGWEGLYAYCLATGRLPFVADATSFESWTGIVKFVAWCFAVPLYREVHFYFAHRLIHVKCLYKYVHSTHHRNTDIEPFAGLCMHPIEHLYYYTSSGHAFYMLATPWAFLWNGIHLILSPAASHSGYEDCMQSDQYHYLHHRFFECNYGTPTFMMDRTFGTFRDQLSTKSKTYKGQHVEGKSVKMDSKTSAKQDAKATLTGPYQMDQTIFNLFTLSCPMLVYAALTQRWGAHRINIERLGVSNAAAVAAYVTLGPILVSLALLLGSSCRLSGLKKAITYPFHKDSASNFGFHIVVGICMSVMPAYHLIHMSLAPPGESVYYSFANNTSL